MYDIRPVITLNKIAKDATTKIYIYLYLKRNRETNEIHIYPTQLEDELELSRKSVYNVLKELESNKTIKIKKIGMKKIITLLE